MNGYVIQLGNGALWRNYGASGPAIFETIENARATIAEFSGRGVLAHPVILALATGPIDGAQKIDGYWVGKAVAA